MKQFGFMKDAIILFVITLIAGICLGGVYEITKEPIEQATIAANLVTYQEVFPNAASFEGSDALKEAAKTSEETLATLGYGGVLVDEALVALDASGNPAGYIISSTSKDGYGGAISISVGIDKEGVITGVGYLSIGETPGLGMNATEPAFKDQYKGKSVESFTVVKGGASADNEIDAISGATITSDAVTNAVNAAIYFVNNCVAQ